MTLNRVQTDIFCSWDKRRIRFADLSALLFESTQVPPYESHKKDMISSNVVKNLLTAYRTLFSLHVVCDPLVLVSV